VPAKIRLHLPLQDLDLLVEDGEHRDQGTGSGGVSGGDSLRLAQLLAAQRRQDRGRLGGDVAAAGALERRGDLRPGQPPCPGRIRCLGQQLQRIGGIQVSECGQGSGK
jgi:hypothetical protein